MDKFSNRYCTSRKPEQLCIIHSPTGWWSALIRRLWQCWGNMSMKYKMRWTFVMMAYRSSVQETTGCTPEKLMLGCIISYMPRNLKKVPAVQKAWELQAKVVHAHKLVEQIMGEEAIQRQKKYQDKTTSRKHFENSEQGHMFIFRTKNLESVRSIRKEITIRHPLI